MKYYFFIFSLLAIACNNSTNVAVIAKYENGKTRIQHSWENPEDTTVFTRSYYYPNGQLGSTGIINGVGKDGPWTWWYSNGNLKAEGHFDMGIAIDSTKCYFEEGGLSRTLFQIDVAPYYWQAIDFHPNGQKSIETFYHGLNSTLDSSWTEWDNTGKLISKGPLRDSYKVGIWQKRNKQGEIITVLEDSTATIKFGESTDKMTD